MNSSSDSRNAPLVRPCVFLARSLALPSPADMLLLLLGNERLFREPVSLLVAVRELFLCHTVARPSSSK